MKDSSIRIQGGVFIWLCAAAAMGSAAYVILNLSSGFWELFFGAVWSCGVFLGVHCVCKRQIIKHAGTVEGERGPLLGISIEAVSVFLLLYFKGVRMLYAGSDMPYVISLVSALVGCGVCVTVVWTVARGMNGRNLDLRYRILRNKYGDLSNHAQIAVLLFLSLALLPMVFSFAAFAMTGLTLSIWVSVGNLVVSSGAYLAVLAKSRRLFFALFTGVVQSDAERRFNPSECKDLWDDDFSICETCAAGSAGGCVTLLFMACPRWLESDYLLIMACGLSFAYIAEFVFVLCDKMNLNAHLRHRWRVEAKSCLNMNRLDNARARKEMIKEKVLLGLDLTSLGEWHLDDELTAVSEGLRRMLNYHFCEDGRMRYLNPATVIGKDVVYRRKAESAFCEAFSEEVGAQYDENTTDEELARMLKELNEFRAGGLSVKDEELADAYCLQLQELIVGLDLQPYATMLMDVSGRDGSVHLELEVERSGVVRICLPTGEMLTCEMSNAIKVIEDKIAA